MTKFEIIYNKHWLTTFPKYLLIPENIHPLDKDYKLDFKDAMFMFGVIQNKVQSYMQDDREIPKNLMEILKQLITKKEYDAFEAYNAKF